jgi:hypothetical protein
MGYPRAAKNLAIERLMCETRALTDKRLKEIASGESGADIPASINIEKK